MRNRFRSVRLDPRDFGIEQGDPLIEFFQRIPIQAFAAKLMGCILTRANPPGSEIMVIHCDTASTRFCLLSTGGKARVEVAIGLQQTE